LLSERDLALASRRIEAFLLCRELGWSWRDLEDAPADVIDDFLYLLTHGHQR
jgi:hypothetical protein